MVIIMAMGNWNNAVITNAGNLLLASALDEGGIEITKVVGGVDTYSVTSLMAQVNVTQPRINLPFILTKNPKGRQVDVKINNIGINLPYTLRQVGIFARRKGTNEPEILLAIIQDNTGEEIPSEADTPEFILEFGFLLLISNELEITAVIDPTVFVTVGDLEKKADSAELTAFKEAMDVTLNGKQEESITLADNAGSTELPKTASGTIKSKLQALRDNVKALLGYFTNGKAKNAINVDNADYATSAGSAVDQTARTAAANAQSTANTAVSGLSGKQDTNVTTTASAASTTQATAGTRTITALFQILINNIALLFASIANAVLTTAQTLTTTQQQQARTNIGAGTSNLTIGNTATTAMAGNTQIPITESGTFTPSMTGYSLINTFGRYYRTGKTVFVRGGFYVNNTETISNTMDVRISGFPFNTLSAPVGVSRPDTLHFNQVRSNGNAVETENTVYPTHLVPSASINTFGVRLNDARGLYGGHANLRTIIPIGTNWRFSGTYQIED